MPFILFSWDARLASEVNSCHLALLQFSVKSSFCKETAFFPQLVCKLGAASLQAGEAVLLTAKKTMILRFQLKAPVLLEDFACGRKLPARHFKAHLLFLFSHKLWRQIDSFISRGDTTKGQQRALNPTRNNFISQT